jgi:hypothetical protein
MPDIYETDTTRTWARDTAQAPHVSDAPQISPAMPGEGGVAALRNRLSWPAIFAGVVVALVTQLLLNLIGMALGAASLAPLSGGASPATFSTGAGIWFGLSSILAALAGGYAAGKFSGAQTESIAGWHGLTTWALTTLLLSYLLSAAAAGILGGLGGAAKTASTAAAQVAAPGLVALADPFSSIEQEVRSTTASNDPAALRDAAIAAVRTAVTGEGLHAAETTERAAQALARAENISVENARTLVQGYEQQYRQSLDQVRQQATRAADDATKAVSRAALLGAISLILGGLAGWLGGRMALGDASFSDRLATASGRARR